IRAHRAPTRYSSCTPSRPNPSGRSATWTDRPRRCGRIPFLEYHSFFRRETRAQTQLLLPVQWPRWLPPNAKLLSWETVEWSSFVRLVGNLPSWIRTQRAEFLAGCSVWNFSRRKFVLNWAGEQTTCHSEGFR